MDDQENRESKRPKLSHPDRPDANRSGTMELRGKGRSTGRSRAAAVGQPPVRPGAGPSQPGRGTVRPQNPPPVAWVRPPAPAEQQFASGRGTRVPGGGDAPTTSGVVSGGGDQLVEGGTKRGGNSGVRGRTARNEILFTRPKNCQTKKGKSGDPVSLTANYFELLQSGKWGLNQYRVDFSTDNDDTRHRKYLMRMGMKNVIQGGYLFDGTVLYTPQRLNPDPLEVFVQEDNGENVRISLRLVGDVTWGDYHYIQLFNLIVRKCLGYMQLQLIGRDYYDPAARTQIPEYKLELWPGYFTSMRQHEKNILLNCEIATKVMRKETAYNVFLECRGGNLRSEFQSKMIGAIVLTSYNNKTYKVDDIDFNSTPQSTFSKKDGTEISYTEYNRSRYNINIRDPNQPMLVSRSKPREIRAGMPETIYLVPELCQLTGLTDQQRNNFHLMKALADNTRIGPSDRMKRLMTFSQRMSSNPEVMAEINKWDLSLAKSLVQFQGRKLPSETIVWGGEGKQRCDDRADWTTGFRNQEMFNAGKMDRMAVIAPAKFHSTVEQFMQTLQRCVQGLRWNIGKPRIFDIRDDRPNSYLDEIDKVASMTPTLIMCVLPTQNADRYDAIKKKCCVDRGIPTQIVVVKSMTSKGVMSIATKIAVQLNCKIGGAPWTVPVPLNGLMIVGYDVCRDTANKSKSFGAIVATLDRQMTRYFSFVKEHRMEEELSDWFASGIELACERYKQQNGRYPEYIVIYRDGVGDGQLPYVYDTEVQNIKNKLKGSIYAGADLKMAFIIVSKRINTRIFRNGDRGCDNPFPGTVIDDVITLPERFDFFIVSQCVRQGTVAPTSYNVIEDTLGLSADRLQILTYKLCHMYFNWSGTVRVPAPCQYAHKLAFLTSQHLHRPANRDLETLLYYL